MRKIILFLALALGVKVNAQIVGGYLPINSSKSFTAGNSTFSNVIARGTLSVGSTATLTGVLTTNSVFANSGQLRLYSGTNSDVIIRAVGASQVITSEINGSPKFQVNSSGATVTGSLVTTGTHSLGSANLTGGNTGTVAVLSDVTVPYYFSPNTELSPGDNDVRYCGMLMPNFHALPTFTAAIGVYVWDNIEVVGYDITVWNNGAVGTAETVTANLVSGSSSTIIALTSALTTTGQAQFNGTVTPTSVSAGTRMLIQYTFPAYATNPTGVWFSAVIKTRRKQ